MDLLSNAINSSTAKVHIENLCKDKKLNPSQAWDEVNARACWFNICDRATSHGWLKYDIASGVFEFTSNYHADKANTEIDEVGEVVEILTVGSLLLILN